MFSLRHTARSHSQSKENYCPQNLFCIRIFSPVFTVFIIIVLRITKRMLPFEPDFDIRFETNFSFF
jgi:hypothetical protein